MKRPNAFPNVAAEPVLSRLDPISRARSACVCKAWRDALEGAPAWRTLILDTDGRSDILAGAAAKARGALQELRLLGPVAHWAQRGMEEVLEAVVRRNRRSLRLLHFNSMPVCVLERLLSVDGLEAEVVADCVTVWYGVPHDLLARAPPFQRLTARALSIRYVSASEPLEPALDALRAYAGLGRLGLCATWTPDQLKKLAAMLRVCDVRSISLGYSVFGAGCGPALASLLCGRLERLDLQACLLSDDDLRPLVAALPADRALLSLDLRWNHTGPRFEMEELLPAVLASPSLRRFHVACTCQPNLPSCYECLTRSKSARAAVEAAFLEKKTSSAGVSL
jgi:hypothetical protein